MRRTEGRGRALVRGVLPHSYIMSYNDYIL